jgi:hypothetical protein
MKKLWNQDSLKSLQGQLGSFSASVKSQLAANMPVLTAATAPASAASSSEASSQPLPRQLSLSGEVAWVLFLL